MEVQLSASIWVFSPFINYDDIIFYFLRSVKKLNEER